jgi:WD40 repeat protein
MDMTKTHVAHDLVHDSPLLSCRFDPSGKFVFVGAQDYSVWRFEISSGTKTELAAESWVRALAFSGDGQTLVTAGYDGRLMWWPVNAEQPTPLRTVEAHHSWIRALAVSPDGALLASVGNDQVVRLWNMADGSPVREMSGHQSYVYNVAFHPDGKQLATGDLMCNLVHWDIDTGKQQRTWQAKSLQKFDKTFVATIGGFRGMTFTPDGKQILCSGITNVTNAFAGVGNPSVVAFDWKAGTQQIEHLSKGKLRGVAWGLAAHSDGTRIAATGGSGGYLLFWKPDAENEFHQMKLKDVARDLDLCSDGLHLAMAHYNGHVSIGKMEAEAKK